WLGASIRIGGISALAVRGGRLAPAETPSDDPAGGPPQGSDSLPVQQELDRVRVAVPAEFGQLVEVEQAADTLFKVAGYGQLPPSATVDELAAAALVLVTGSPPAGYVRVEIVDGEAHIEGLSVRPRFMRRGLGSGLVEAACAWATEQGYQLVTLCTFAEVPWNGPFYAGLGFVELDDDQLSPGLVACRATEADLGLDAMGRRTVMCRSLPATAGGGTETDG
ncbi:MAG: GNAT family N-acetyltransferase, partial [Jatrophihabitans sp.]